MVIAAVYVICSVSQSNSDRILLACMEVHCLPFPVMPVNMSWFNPSPVSCVQAFYYYTHQNDSWHIKHSVRESIRILSIVILSWIEVTAVMIFDTVHQALITHTSSYSSLIPRPLHGINCRLQYILTLSRTGEIHFDFSWLSGKEFSNLKKILIPIPSAGVYW